MSLATRQNPLTQRTADRLQTHAVNVDDVGTRRNHHGLCLALVQVNGLSSTFDACNTQKNLLCALNTPQIQTVVTLKNVPI